MPIFIFVVEDARAMGWAAEIALKADSRGAAYRHLRSLGLHKTQFTLGIERTARTAKPGEVTEPEPGQLLRRRYDDGWTDWAPVTEADPLNWKDDAHGP